MAQIIDNHFGRAKQLVSAPITALDDFHHAMIRLDGIAPQGNGFVPMRIESTANILDGLDAVAAE